MRIDLRHIKRRLLKVREIWPLSLARKVQATFGAAVILVLALALLIPYIWMNKLTTKGLLDAGRSRSKVLLDRHFQLEAANQTLRALDHAGREHLLKQRAELEGGKGREGRGLDHHRVAREEGGRNLPRGEEDRVVPGRDRRDHSQRTAPNLDARIPALREHLDRDLEGGRLRKPHSGTDNFLRCLGERLPLLSGEDWGEL